MEVCLGVQSVILGGALPAKSSLLTILRKFIFVSSTSKKQKIRLRSRERKKKMQCGNRWNVKENCEDARVKGVVGESKEPKLVFI